MSVPGSSDTEPDRLLVMGQVAAPYGVRGWLHVIPYTEQQGGLLDYPRWYLRQRGKWRPVRLLEGRLHGKGLVVQLEGCSDRDQAGSLGGAEIGIHRSELPATGPDEYYWSDLIGLDVVTLDGVSLGTVERLMETGSNDVLVVQGERERLVPYLHGTVVRSVDLEHHTIRVDWDPDF